MTRVRRCSWEDAGGHCRQAATTRARTSYLGVELDRHPLFCDNHAARLDELLHTGWAYALEELETEEVHTC